MYIQTYKVYEMLNVELQLYSALTGKTDMLQAIFVQFTTIRSHHEAAVTSLVNTVNDSLKMVAPSYRDA